MSDNICPEHDDVAAHQNLVFGEADDYLASEMVSLLNHRYADIILEFQAEYYNGDKLWHPLT